MSHFAIDKEAFTITKKVFQKIRGEINQKKARCAKKIKQLSSELNLNKIYNLRKEETEEREYRKFKIPPFDENILIINKQYEEKYIKEMIGKRKIPSGTTTDDLVQKDYDIIKKYKI